MSILLGVKNTLPLALSVLSNPRILKVSPPALRFLSAYMNKFRVRSVGDHRILHSHLPPLNSPAYSRFIKEHLILRTPGPSHAQIGLTNACPHNCACCYNRERRGQVMDTDTIIRIARELKQMGVVWLGLTGGEPLLNRDIVEITDSISGDCAVKLFTTGCTLTRRLASDLKHAGLFSVSISLDHWLPEDHDAGRRYRGAFREALQAIDIFKSLDMDVGVSAILPRDMIRSGGTEDFLRFLIGLGVNEAWLSEVKPTVKEFWDEQFVITEDDRLSLVKLQDRYNREGRITVNYLGHFEGKECFGCNAGHKMVYVDSFGDVSPCVFTPLRFGNVRNESIRQIFNEMTRRFPSEDTCFINKNYRLLKKYSRSGAVLDKADSLALLREVSFGPLPRFSQLHYRTDSFPEVLPAGELARGLERVI